MQHSIVDKRAHCHIEQLARLRDKQIILILTESCVLRNNYEMCNIMKILLLNY